jgi:glycosyltransferase involved in cell wall biosynthesis
LLVQDFPRRDYELIFVDNEPDDGGRDIPAQHQEIKLLREPERGSHTARNRGIREARGEILAFTDSGCFPQPGWLRSIDSAFRQASTQVLLGPRQRGADTVFVRRVVDGLSLAVLLIGGLLSWWYGSVRGGRQAR